MLRISHLSKSFGNQKVIDDLSFEANAGDIIVVLGKSGAGKTTLLRCINQLQNFDSGKIELEGITKNYNDQVNKSLQLKIGMVFQNFNLFPHKNVLENCIEAAIYLKLLTKEEAIKKAKELLEKLEVLDKINDYPATLSGGQKQRVAIARACMLEPSVLCFDEPTSALDAESRNQVVTLLQDLSQTGMIILVVSHDKEFIELLNARTISIQKRPS